MLAFGIYTKSILFEISKKKDLFLLWEVFTYLGGATQVPRVPILIFKFNLKCLKVCSE